MGRQLRRVPLDFDWPLDKTWGGFLNPFYGQSINCPDCEGSGYSAEANRLKDQWYGNAPFKPEDRGSRPWTPADLPVRAFAERNVNRHPDHYGVGESAILREARRLCGHWNQAWNHHLNEDDVAALVAGGRLHDLTSEFVPGKGWQLKDPPVIPTPEQVNEWSISGMGHDSINQWICVRKECERLRVPEICARCNGEATLWPSPEIKQLAEDWQETAPPSGEGYQLWQTVSEGSPISPVFATPEELADYLIGPDYSWSKNDEGTTREQWLRFINGPGWAMSAAVFNGEFMSGVQAVTAQ